MTETMLSRLVALAFSCTIGVTLLVFGCALPQYSNWWPLFILFFYLISPLLISRRLSAGDAFEGSACTDLCIFFTTGTVISSFCLPLVLAHTAVIKWGACALVMSGNIVVFGTIFFYFYTVKRDELQM